MAIQLYRKGTTHNVRGVQCELRNFDSSELSWCLENGWLRSEKDVSDAENKEQEKLKLAEQKEKNEVIEKIRVEARTQAELKVKINSEEQAKAELKAKEQVSRNNQKRK